MASEKKDTSLPQGSGKGPFSRSGLQGAKAGTLRLPSDPEVWLGNRLGHTHWGIWARARPSLEPPKGGWDPGTGSESQQPVPRPSAEGSAHCFLLVSTDVRWGKATFWGLCFERLWLQQAESAKTDLPGSTGLQDGLLPA